MTATAMSKQFINPENCSGCNSQPVGQIENVAGKAVAHDAIILAKPAEHLLSQVAILGGDAEETRYLSGLAEFGQLDDSLLIPLESFVALAQQAAKSLCSTNFGWTAGQVYDLTSLGPIGHAMLTAGTVGIALHLLCDALHAVQSVSRLTLTLEQDTAVIRYRILDPAIWPRDQDAELTLSVAVRLLKISAGPNWRPDTLLFEHSEPEGPNHCQGRARYKVIYGSETNELRFPAAVLETPMPEHDAQQYQRYSLAAFRMKHALEARMSLTSQVRQQFFLRFGSGTINQSDIAIELGLSRRSLRRQLADSGTSYTRELARCRHEFTKLQLLNSRLSVADIAYDLGYSDQSAFERAFRRLTGQTPTQYRRKALGLTDTT